MHLKTSFNTPSNSLLTVPMRVFYGSLLPVCGSRVFGNVSHYVWIYISLFIGCLVETRNYSNPFLAFIASTFRVTEENLVFETVQSGPYSSFKCFLCS